MNWGLLSGKEGPAVSCTTLQSSQLPDKSRWAIWYEAYMGGVQSQADMSIALAATTGRACNKPAHPPVVAAHLVISYPGLFNIHDDPAQRADLLLPIPAAVAPRPLPRLPLKLCLLRLHAQCVCARVYVWPHEETAFIAVPFASVNAGLLSILSNSTAGGIQLVRQTSKLHRD